MKASGCEHCSSEGVYTDTRNTCTGGLAYVFDSLCRHKALSILEHIARNFHSRKMGCYRDVGTGMMVASTRDKGSCRFTKPAFLTLETYESRIHGPRTSLRVPLLGVSDIITSIICIATRAACLLPPISPDCTQHHAPDELSVLGGVDGRARGGGKEMRERLYVIAACLRQREASTHACAAILSFAETLTMLFSPPIWRDKSFLKEGADAGTKR
ncbi:hypothetical protein B0H16DRAFT_1715526 [Mycena metata]|uniref:Uncharacterized protein n=1 Tax=Mycena metata TaxID=1033252 RepID=A0AAD7JQI9_9AGAR|nr:hypothetical protein B0H16DRAFT_1715526 [Mycena metata]